MLTLNSGEHYYRRRVRVAADTHDIEASSEQPNQDDSDIRSELGYIVGDLVLAYSISVRRDLCEPSA